LPSPFEERNKILFKRTCVLPQGVFYEDDKLQIGLQSEYRTGQGRVMLYFGNGTNDPFTNFLTTLPTSPILNIVVAEKVSPVVAAKTQGRLLLMIRCATTFRDSYPSIQISFMQNGRQTMFRTELPITFAKFIDPIVMDSTQFTLYWQQIKTIPTEYQELFKSLTPIQPQSIINLLSVGLHLNVLQNIDPNPYNIVAAGTFYTQTEHSVCMLRVETSPQTQMLRITTRSFNPQVALGITFLLLEYLGGIKR